MFWKKKKDAAADAAASAPAAAAATDEQPATKKRSKLKLILLACVPLVLGGAGYGGWMLYAGKHGEPSKEAAAGAHGGHGEGGEEGQDATEVSSISAEDVAAETSFTYSFALSELLKEECGPAEVTALKAASDKEAAADGKLVNASWMAATRRLGTVTEKSCNRMLSEIENADARAASASAPKKDAGHH